MKQPHLICSTLLIAMLGGCSSTTPTSNTDNPNAGRYQMDQDAAPVNPQSVAHVEDAKPRYEPYSRGGNKDYSVFGQSYKINKNTVGFRQVGYASWYGMKFHGHKTSNGEIYDMYSMTAAHKTLPLPSYVKVTNLDNGKTAVVRINDRGPFHTGRIIDLSYAAAYKLGVLETGTARVEIDAIDTKKPKPVEVSPPLAIESKKTQPTPLIKSAEVPPRIADNDTGRPVAKRTKNTSTETVKPYAIQVSASKYLESSRTLSKELSQKLSVTSYIDSNHGNHRVFLGPFTDYSMTEKMLEKVKILGYQGAFIKKNRMTQ